MRKQREEGKTGRRERFERRNPRVSGEVRERLLHVKGHWRKKEAALSLLHLTGFPYVRGEAAGIRRCCTSGQNLLRLGKREGERRKKEGEEGEGARE